MNKNFSIKNIVQDTSIQQYIKAEINQNNINENDYINYVQQALLYNKNK